MDPLGVPDTVLSSFLSVEPPQSALPVPSMEDASQARKRRREAVDSLRAATAAASDLIPLVSPSHVSDSESSDGEEQPASKKVCWDDPSWAARVVSDIPAICTNQDSSSHKRPQKKYDPLIPLTKEATAIWRREQRRKRNRESAALSRQRQRGRILELEQEIQVWRDKHQGILDEIAQLEQAPSPPPLPSPQHVIQEFSVDLDWDDDTSIPGTPLPSYEDDVLQDHTIVPQEEFSPTLPPSHEEIKDLVDDFSPLVSPPLSPSHVIKEDDIPALNPGYFDTSLLSPPPKMTSRPAKSRLIPYDWHEYFIHDFL
jgi:bZIP transcription factor